MPWKDYTFIELPILAAEIAVDLAKKGHLREGETVDDALLAILRDLRENAGDDVTSSWEEDV